MYNRRTLTYHKDWIEMMWCHSRGCQMTPYIVHTDTSTTGTPQSSGHNNLARTSRLQKQRRPPRLRLLLPSETCYCSYPLLLSQNCYNLTQQCLPLFELQELPTMLRSPILRRPCRWTSRTWRSAWTSCPLCCWQPWARTYCCSRRGSCSLPVSMVSKSWSWAGLRRLLYVNKRISI